jgi:hypothetical protein
MGTTVLMEENKMEEINGAYPFPVIIWIVTEKLGNSAYSRNVNLMYNLGKKEKGYMILFIRI